MKPLKLLKDTWEFFIHVFVGTLIFVLLTLAAYGLHLLVEWLESTNFWRGYVYGMKFAEFCVFTVDIVLYLIFIVTNGIEFAAKLIKRR